MYQQYWENQTSTPLLIHRKEDPPPPNNVANEKKNTKWKIFYEYSLILLTE